MRALAALAIVTLVVVGVWAYTRPAPPAGSPSASPSPTSTAVGPPVGTAAVSTTPAGSPTPTPTGTPIAFGPPLVRDAVTVRGVAASSGPDFRYIVTGQGSGTTFWIVLLDLDAKTAQTVAQIDVVVPQGSQSVPRVDVSSSANGGRILIAATEPAGATHFLLMDVRRGHLDHLITQPQLSTGVISPDGERYAFTNTREHPDADGLWVGRTADGGERLLVSDEEGVGFDRPQPISFSPDSSQIAAAVTRNADFRSGILLVAADGAVESLEDATILEGASRFDWGGAPGDAWAWDIVGPLGGGNSIYAFDLRTGGRTLVYTPAQNSLLQDAGRSPKLDRFFTREGQAVIGAGGPVTLWIRMRDGSATKIADVGEAGPHSPWWSPDGSRLYAFFGGDDSVGAVGELLTRTDVLTFCIRAPSAPGFVCP